MDLESSSWIDQTLGPLSPPLFSRFFVRLLKQGMRDIMRHKVRVMDCFGMQYVSFNLKFVHICWQTALERYLPKKNLHSTANLTTTKQPEKNHGASIDLQHWDQQRSTLQCFPFRAREHFTDFTFKWLCLDPSSMPFFCLPSSPNTKPSPLHRRFRSAPNSGSSGWSSL